MLGFSISLSGGLSQSSLVTLPPLQKQQSKTWADQSAEIVLEQSIILGFAAGALAPRLGKCKCSDPGANYLSKLYDFHKYLYIPS